MTSKTWTIGVKLGERMHQLAIREEGLCFQSRASKQKLSCGGFIVHRPCGSRRAGPRRRFAVQNRTAVFQPPPPAEFDWTGFYAAGSIISPFLIPSTCRGIGATRNTGAASRQADL
jgi:hypothetical protein